MLDSTPPPPHTTTSESSSPPQPPGDNPDTMRISMYYSVTESCLLPKNDTHPVPPQETGSSLKKLRRMTTFGVGNNSRILVAVARLLDAQLSIDRVELTLNSRSNVLYHAKVQNIFPHYYRKEYYPVGCSWSKFVLSQKAL